MGLWKNRPLFTWCCVLMASVSVGFLLDGTFRTTLWILSAVTLAVGAVMRLCCRCSRVTAVTVMVAAVVAALGTAQGASFRDKGKTLADTLAGQTHTLRAVVIEMRGSGGHMASYGMEVKEIDGASAQVYAILTCDYEADFQVGNEILIRGEAIRPEDTVTSLADLYRMISDGYMLGFESYGEGDSLYLGESEGLSIRMTQWRRSLAATMEVLFGREASGLPAALLLGERDGMPDTVRRDFSRAGVAHMLAISGMHMCLLLGGLDMLLRKLRVRKRVRAAVLLFLGGSYLTLLGFPPSATRAVVMLGMAYLSRLCLERAEGITALGVAGALILGITPQAAMDAGFWMSFSSALGLLTALPLVRRPMVKRKIRLEQMGVVSDPGTWSDGLLTALLTGVTAMTFSLWITAMTVGELSWLSPVVTLLMTPLVTVLLAGVPLALLLNGTPLGGLAAQGVVAVCRWTVGVAEVAARPSWVVVSLRHAAVTVVAVGMVVCILILLGHRLRRPRILVIPAAVGWAAVLVITACTLMAGRGTVTVDYLQPSSASEMLVLGTGRGAVICDLSNGSHTSLSRAVRAAEAGGATEISAVVLTHYHTRMAGALGRVMAAETVRTVWLPCPLNEEDYYVMTDCLSKAERYGVTVMTYDYEAAVPLWDGVCLRVGREALSRSAQPVLLLTLEAVTRDGAPVRMTYCGGSVFESDLSAAAVQLVKESSYVIFGRHGPATQQPLTCVMGDVTQWVGAADRETAARIPVESLPPDLEAVHVGRGRFALAGDT